MVSLCTLHHCIAKNYEHWNKTDDNSQLVIFTIELPWSTAFTLWFHILEPSTQSPTPEDLLHILLWLPQSLGRHPSCPMAGETGRPRQGQLKNWRFIDLKCLLPGEFKGNNKNNNKKWLHRKWSIELIEFIELDIIWWSRLMESPRNSAKWIELSLLWQMAFSSYAFVLENGGAPLNANAKSETVDFRELPSYCIKLYSGCFLWAVGHCVFWLSKAAAKGSTFCHPREAACNQLCSL